MKKVYIIAFLILCFWKGVIADGIVPKITWIEEEYSPENSDVEKITPTKAIVTNEKGVVMSTGPSSRVKSSKDYTIEYRYKPILTIPQNGIVTLTHKLKDNIENILEEKFTTNYWYYAEYDGKKGWVSTYSMEFVEEVNEVDKTPEEKEPTVVPTPDNDKTPGEKEPTTVQPKPDSDKPNPTHVQPDDNEAKNDIETIIICILSSIVGALICLIIIMFTNRKSKKEE